MKSLKVLFVIDSLGQGGSERSLVELLPYLAKANITSVLVCLNRREEGFQKEVESQGFRIHFLGKGRIRRWIQLRKILKVEHPDVVHTTLFKSDVLGRLAAAGLPYPVLSSLVNISYGAVRLQDSNIRASRLRVVQEIDSWTARHCTKHFHAVSKAVKSAAMNDLRIPSERITIVERGRDANRLGERSMDRQQRARLQLGLKEDHEVLVTVGRHEYQKGQRYLLEAVASLQPRHPRLMLIVAGRQGNATAALQRMQRETGLNGVVRFLGFREDIADILAAADVFVFPSLYEGLPGAVIEAMALSLPIVAFDIPPLREVVQPDYNAFLVPMASSESLANAIHTLLIDRKKACEFGIHSRTIFEERFTISRSASRMVELYYQVASKQ